MKKIVSKFLPIALLVLAMSVSSIAVSADELERNVTYNNGVVDVEATGGEGGDVVILATRQNSDGNVSTLSGLATDYSSIVYVDQAAPTNSTFRFIPKTDVQGNTISVFLGGGGREVSVNNIATNNVVLYANGGNISGTDYAWIAEDGVYTYNRTAPIEKTETPGEEVTLPTKAEVEKAGYTLEGWYKEKDFSGAAVTEIAATEVGEVVLYAKYTADVDYVYDSGYCVDGNKKVGVISVTAQVDDYRSVKKYGFQIYRRDGENGVIEFDPIEGEIDKNGFYTVVYGVPEEYFGTTVVFKAFVADASGKVTYGEGKELTVNPKEGNLKELGTLAALKQELGLSTTTPAN